MRTIKDFHIGVLSAHRPANVVPLSAFLGRVTWYVPMSEVAVYKQHGAEFVVGLPEAEVGRGNIPEARNAILRDAWAMGKIAVQSDDDLKKIMVIVDDEKKTTAPISFEQAIITMAEELDKTPYFLAGVSPTPNAFYYHKPFSDKLFIIGSLMIAKPCDLYFDTTFRLKEDYDYTLQHLTKYGGALRCNRILPTYQHYSNSGGAVSIRSHATEQHSIDLLRKKWGDMVKLNPKRADEVLLRFKKNG